MKLNKIVILNFICIGMLLSSCNKGNNINTDMIEKLEINNGKLKGFICETKLKFV